MSNKLNGLSPKQATVLQAGLILYRQERESELSESDTEDIEYLLHQLQEILKGCKEQ